ncbi:putative Beta-TrCP [Seiridium cardinale]|uniref:Beta-TrCP n=1 Tax=Seiridium cardinale TaxID=138064 RepID=A0ABR2Y707_9PEZI
MVNTATLPVPEWTPAQRIMHDYAPSTSGASAYSNDTGAEVEKDFLEPIRPRTANPFQRTRSLSSTVHWRRRPKSLVLNADDSPVHAGSSEDAIEETPSELQPEGCCGTGASLKGKFRRASLSLMKGIVQRRDRRSSEPEKSHDDQQQQPRPSTAHSAWHKLRQATSFRHSRMAHGGRSNGLDTIYSPLESTFSNTPVPGNRLEPPIIPSHTGAAAKASAAYQNEYLAMVEREEWLAEHTQNDRESGIGISIMNADEVDLATSQGSRMSRVDFISRLPSELAIQTLSHLDATYLTAAAQVSRAWHGLVQDQQIWRQSFLREKTATYATTEPVVPGTGFGVPAIRPGNDWQKIYKARQQLDQSWKQGTSTRPVYLNGHLDSIYCLQFDESKIITGSRDKTIRIWDMHTFQCRLVIGPPEVVNDTSVLFDANGRPLHYASVPEKERDNESVPATVSFPTHHKASILCLQYDDGILVTGSSDGTCIVYNVKSGYRPIRRLQHHTAAVLDLAFDDKHIVTCSKDISICVWDRETGALLKQLKGHTGPVNAVQLRGNSIVSCSGDFKVKLWNIDSGKVVREFEGHTKGLACSQFSDDGRFIASAGSDKVIRIWDARTGECIREIQAHDSLVRSLHIDSFSGRLISGSYDTDIKVFDMATGDQLLDFPRWHASWVLSAKSDYRRIVSTGQDPKILIMDFGANVQDIGLLESTPTADVARDAGFI